MFEYVLIHKDEEVLYDLANKLLYKHYFVRHWDNVSYFELGIIDAEELDNIKIRIKDVEGILLKKISLVMEDGKDFYEFLDNYK